MKFIYKIWTILLLMATYSSLEAQIFGLRTGVHFLQPLATETASFREYRLGGVLELPFSRHVSFETGLIFSKVSLEVQEQGTIRGFFSSTDYELEAKIKLHFFNLPIGFRLGLPLGGQTSIYLGLYGTLTYGLWGNSMGKLRLDNQVTYFDEPVIWEDGGTSNQFDLEAQYVFGLQIHQHEIQFNYGFSPANKGEAARFIGVSYGYKFQRKEKAHQEGVEEAN